MKSTDHRSQSHHREARAKPLVSEKEEERKKEKEEEAERKSKQKLAEAKAKKSENKAAMKQVKQKAMSRMQEVKQIQMALDKQRMLDSNKVFLCTRKKCKKTFSSQTQLTAHERTHAIEDALKESQKNSDKSNKKSKIKCTVPGCKKFFKTEEGLAHHVKDVHSNASESSSQIPAGDQQQEIELEESGKSGADGPDGPEGDETALSSQLKLPKEKKEKTKKVKKNHACTAPDCNKKFKSDEGLKDHVRAVHS